MGAPPEIEILGFPDVHPEHIQSAADRFQIDDGTIDIWSFSLGCQPGLVESWGHVLDADERERASRYVHENHRTEFIVAHGVLRWLLSRYTSVAPGRLRFGSGVDGKPFITHIDSDIAFNLTHSNGRALLAIARMEVGIDLEFARSDFDGLDIAKRYFFGSELADIRSGPPDERRKAFFRYWVAKEAVLKGQGVGLGFPLDQFLVSFTDAQQQEATVRSMDARRLGEDWFVRMLPSDPAWPAAVTARGTAWSVQLRHPEG